MSQSNPERIKTSYFPIANPLDRDKQNNEKKSEEKQKMIKKIKKKNTAKRRSEKWKQCKFLRGNDP